ncbi:MAG: hypothetical protein FJY82_05010 [Candidatus Aminicenantes bacterium]|nr:hypothetical protein [Candidatus Aminicenantes bacterium]
MKCPSCQADNNPDSRFCRFCATPLPTEEASDATPGKTLLAAFDDLPRGSLFAGRYEILEEVGKGGMGKVYKAFDRTLRETVALKLLKPEISFNEKAVARFRNELKFARKISHRHVCRLFDLGEAAVVHFITMEFVEGEDLKAFIRRSGHLTPAKAAIIARQVAEGLAEAHRLGVVHRDLKPQNVMIDREGNAKIMDFGLARFAESDGMTGSGVLLGTPEYMSPEQFDLKEVDARSDIYALGAILFEMVTGQAPFSGETPLSVALKHKNEKAKDTRELNPLVPEPLARLIAKLLEKDPAKRLQSAEDTIAELDRIGRDYPSIVRDMSRADKIGSKEVTVKFRPRKLILPALALTAAVAFLVILSRNGPAPSGPAPAEKSRSAVASRVSGRVPPPSPRSPSSSGESRKIYDNLRRWIVEKNPEAVKDVEKALDSVKVYLPDKGPTVEAWKKLKEEADRLGSREGHFETHSPSLDQSALTNDMQTLLSLVSERESAQQARDTMRQSKAEAQSKVDPGKHFLFRLARYEEGNADDAFAKNDFSGAKALYRILDRIYLLCLQCNNDKSCLETLKGFIAGLKFEAGRLPPNRVDGWLLEYAREIEKQAQTFLARQELDNAGGAFIRAGFLYQKIKESAAAV